MGNCGYSNNCLGFLGGSCQSWIWILVIILFIYCYGGNSCGGCTPCNNGGNNCGCCN